MRLETTPARQTYPPILFLWCPGRKKGHWWAELNHRWYTDSTATPRLEKWCPEHQKQRKASTSRKLSTAARARARDKPIPKRRKCCSPSPGSHPVGAVLAASKFYRRHESRSDGSVRFVLDSRCKQCRREETKAYRDAHKDDPEWKAREKLRISQQAAKRKAGRAEIREQDDIIVESGPFRAWLEAVASNGPLSTLSIASGLDRDTLSDLKRRPVYSVSLAVVDRVGIEAGWPGLSEFLYPVTE